jgi:hypothetical protein
MAQPKFKKLKITNYLSLFYYILYIKNFSGDYTKECRIFYALTSFTTVWRPEHFAHSHYWFHENGTLNEILLIHLGLETSGRNIKNFPGISNGIEPEVSVTK